MPTQIFQDFHYAVVSMLTESNLTPLEWLIATRGLSFEEMGFLFTMLHCTWQTGERDDYTMVGASAFGLLPSESDRIWSTAAAAAYEALLPFVLDEATVRPHGRA